MQLFVATLNFTVVRKIVNLAVSFVLKNTFGNRPKKFDFVHQTNSLLEGAHGLGMRLKNDFHILSLT